MRRGRQSQRWSGGDGGPGAQELALALLGVLTEAGPPGRWDVDLQVII